MDAGQSGCSLIGFVGGLSRWFWFATSTPGTQNDASVLSFKVGLVGRAWWWSEFSRPLLASSDLLPCISSAFLFTPRFTAALPRPSSSNPAIVLSNPSISFRRSSASLSLFSSSPSSFRRSISSSIRLISRRCITRSFRAHSRQNRSALPRRVPLLSLPSFSPPVDLADTLVVQATGSRAGIRHNRHDPKGRKLSRVNRVDCAPQVCRRSWRS